MPIKHTEQFKVRYYECDAYGHLNNAFYLRFMQEAAFAASAAVGLSREIYEQMRRVWIIRETEIEYLQPVRAEELLEVSTWVAGVRRVMSRRMYEFKRASTDELVAQAYTDWVYLDRDSMTPTTIPPEVAEAYLAKDENPPPIPRDPFPKPPPPPTGAFKLRRRVEWRDIDGLQHLTNAAYLAYAEDCAVQLTASVGWPVARWKQQGIAFVARRNRIEYLLPALIDDELEITTWLFDIRPATVTRHYAITRAHDNTLLAQVQTLWVMMDLGTGRPKRIPPSLQEDFGPNIAQRKG
ncbi:MAG: hypothetical protein GTO14_25280 [Anaerolineales bacterium]|nr:hypothetical protein [Anaerolineales bacterium]